MQLFWEEFEKKAISGKLVDTALMSGLLRRSGVGVNNPFAKKLLELAGDTPKGDWRKLTTGWARTSKGYLESQRKRTIGTKSDPIKASKELMEEIKSLSGRY